MCISLDKPVFFVYGIKSRVSIKKGEDNSRGDIKCGSCKVSINTFSCTVGYTLVLNFVAMKYMYIILYS